MKKELKKCPAPVWLVEWQWVGERAKKTEPIAAILNGRFSSEHVKDIVEQLYFNDQYEYDERIDYARNKRFNPFPAHYGVLEGYVDSRQIICGDNPFLNARLVRNLRVFEDEARRQTLEWEEVPRELPLVLRREREREDGST